MTQPTSATGATPTLAQGALAEVHDDSVVLALLGTDYLLRLLVGQRPTTRIGQRIAGAIHAQARRVDIVGAGGRYIEPLVGRPHRVQGEVIAVDPHAQTITVDAAVPIICRLQSGQRTDQFKPGDFVSFDVLPGARFTPTPTPAPTTAP